ncbi:hypothetical protein NDU88_001628 [Pleurodeles waltl]|uniref:Uncharacterized protein n=1 Tax=Pleurodeles waltl TaxID=8319 RepID=A0AAV7WMI5_PLEWA|nr:hypothetical protein NDU88_001628 [Pleurodeles waltl]
MAGGSSRQPRPLGARRLSGVRIGGAGAGEGTPSVSARRQEQGRRLPLSGASAGAVQELAHAGNSARAIRKGTGRVRPPIRTYGVFARGESVSEGLVEVKGSGVERRATRVGDSHVSDADMRFLQGGQCGSEGDPGELLTGLEPWEEEEVTAGPSTASCTGYRRGGEAVRAKELVTQYATGTGFAPPDGRVSKGHRPGYASEAWAQNGPTATAHSGGAIRGSDKEGAFWE